MNPKPFILVAVLFALPVRLLVSGILRLAQRSAPGRREAAASRPLARTRFRFPTLQSMC